MNAAQKTCNQCQLDGLVREQVDSDECLVPAGKYYAMLAA